MLFTQDARFARSPEAYPRKKLTGSDSTRIITEACTACDVLVLIRSISSCRTIPISWAAIAAEIRKTPAPTIRLTCRPFRIDPVNRL